MKYAAMHFHGRSSLSNMFWLHTDVNKYHGRHDQGFDYNHNSD